MRARRFFSISGLEICGDQGAFRGRDRGSLTLRPCCPALILSHPPTALSETPKTSHLAETAGGPSGSSGSRGFSAHVVAVCLCPREMALLYMGLLVYMSMKCCQDFWDPWGRREGGKVTRPPPKLPSSPEAHHPFSLTARISHSTLPWWFLMPFKDPFWGSSEPHGEPD